MVRVRTKQKQPGAKATTSPSPSIPSLLSKAQDLIVQCDYPLARKFTERVLAREDVTSAEKNQAREMLAVVLLEVGDVDGAKHVRCTPARRDPLRRTALDLPLPRTPSPRGSLPTTTVCLSVPRTAHGR